ncbi:hypothetical protein [Saccharopolyspora shandongensis]|uniref:hypothetical protein n=1 Tax=Saccharopolyspora shandongensis TaxID=418495 RepID=UPI0033D34637
MTGKDDLAVAEPRTVTSEPTGYAWLITAMLVLLVLQRSAVLGWTVGLVTLAGLVAPAVTGRMVDAAATAHQGYLNVWTLVGVLLIAGAVIAAFTIDPRRDARALGTD